MKLVRVLILVIVSVICFSSCSDKFHSGFITKRKYNKGFYISCKKNSLFTDEKQKTKSSNCKTIINNCILNDSKSDSITELSLKNNLQKLNKDVKNLQTPSVCENVSYTSVEVKNNSKCNSKPVNERKYISKSIAVNLESKKNKTFGINANGDWNAAFDAIQIFFIVLLFILFTVIYTVGIISSSPGFPIIFAVPIAMLMAIVSIVTGIYFY